MPDFQTTVNLTQAFGVPGEIVYDGPIISKPWQLISTPQLNVIGATAYTINTPATDTASGIAQAGGTGIFCGVLACPKSYANFSGSLSPTLTLGDDTVAELVTTGQMLLTLANASNPGDLVVFDQTTGALSTVPGQTSFTASNATSVLTVTGTPVGTIGPGLTFTIGGDFVKIVSNGTGTGGAGTYNLDIAVGTVGSATYTASNVIAASGKTIIPRAKTILRAGAAASIAICELNG